LDVSLNRSHGFPVFATSLMANSVSKKEDEFAESKLTDEEISQIRELASDENIQERV